MGWRAVACPKLTLRLHAAKPDLGIRFIAEPLSNLDR